jgi:hypothetical protein
METITGVNFVDSGKIIIPELIREPDGMTATTMRLAEH